MIVQTALSGLLVFLLLVSGGLGTFFDILSQLVDYAVVHPGEQTASILPPDTDGYLTINLRPGLSQLEEMQRVLSKWIENPAIKGESQDQIARLALEKGIDIESDVLPWVGPELALGVSHDPGYMMMGRGPAHVVIVGTYDRAKSDAFVFGKLLPLMAKGGRTPPGPTGSYRGVDTLYDTGNSVYLAFTSEYIILSTVQSRLEAVLNLYLDGGNSLATTTGFQTARAKLPAGRMAMGYVNIAHMIDGFAAASKDESEKAVLLSLKSFLPSYAGGSAHFVGDGIRTDYYYPAPAGFSGYPAIGENPLASANITPIGALGFFSTENLTSWWQWVKPGLTARWAEFKKMSGDPQFPDSLDAWLSQTKIKDAWLPLGFNWEQDVLSWMNGEISLAAIPFVKFESPNLLLMVEIDDPALVEDKLELIFAGLNQLNARVGAGEVKLVPTTVHGRPATRIQWAGFGPDVSPTYAFLDAGTSHYLVFGLTETALSLAVYAANNPAASLAQFLPYQSTLTSLPGPGMSFSYIGVPQVVGFLLPLLPLDQILGKDGMSLAPALLGPLAPSGSSELSADNSTALSGTSLLRVRQVTRRIYLDPVKVQRQIGDNFTVDVFTDEVWPGASDNLSGIEFHLAFNSNQLEVADADNITEGIQIAPVLPEGIGSGYSIDTNSVNNTSGWIDYKLTLDAPATLLPGAKVKLASITFHARNRAESNFIFRMPPRLTDATGAMVPVVWQGSLVRTYWPPAIIDTAAVPSMIAILGMFKGDSGPEGTNLVVEVDPKWGSGGVGVARVTANLRTLLLSMLRYPLTIELRTDQPPLNDVRVRQALSMAIDRSSFGAPRGIVLNPGETLPVDYDPEMAKRLLAEAGYPNGFMTEIVCTQSYAGLASIVRDQWAKIGVKLQISVAGTLELYDMRTGMNYRQMLLVPGGWQVVPRDKVESWEQWLSGLQSWDLWHFSSPKPVPAAKPTTPVPVPASWWVAAGDGAVEAQSPQPESVYRRYLSLWELLGNLPWFLGENDLQQVMTRLNLGEYTIPITVTDAWENRVYSQVELTIVDSMLPLTKGWNLVSLPVRLDDAFSKWSDIFNLGDGLRASDALRYDPEQGWVGITPDYRLKPLEAIYVYASQNDQIGAIFARNPTPPPMRDLKAGWNLVGLAISPADGNSMPVKEAMVSVEQDASGLRGYSIVVSPSQQSSYGQDYRYQDSKGNSHYFGGYGWNLHQSPWIYTVGSSEVKNVAANGGYWVFMEHADTLAGFSTTPVSMVYKPVPEPGYDLPMVPRYSWEPNYRTVFEEYRVGSYTKIFVKYVGNVSPSKVFEFYQKEMANLGWKLTAWNAQIDSANLTFHREVGGAKLDARIDVGQWTWVGSQAQQEITVLYELREPGVDLPDVPRFDWRPVFMAAYNRYTDDLGTHTSIQYQDADWKLSPTEAFKFYGERMTGKDWKFDGGESKSDYAWLNFHRTDQQGRTYKCRIDAKWGQIVIGHHAPEPVEQPKYGGVLNMGMAAPPPYFDEASGSIAIAPTLYLTNEELLMGDWTKGPAGSYEATWLYNKFPTPNTVSGSLAESWEVTGNQTLILHIRKGVHFQNKPPVNGRELKAGDVVYSLKRLWETSTSLHFSWRPWADYFQVLDGGPWIKATDNYTVEIKVLPGKLPPVYELILDRAKVLPAEVTDLNNWQNALGTGPFVLTGYATDNTSASFANNPGYWMKDPRRTANSLPYLDGVNYLFMPDRATRLAALRAGNIDWLGGPTSVSWAEASELMKTNPELQHSRYLPAQTMGIFMRTDNQTAPWADTRVRRALAMAIDKDMIKNKYYGGNAEILTTPIVPVKDFTDMYIPPDWLPPATRELYTYNPSKTKALLREAGYPNGFKAEIVVNPGQVDMASIVQAYFASVGVDLQVTVLEHSAWQAAGRNKTYKDMYMGDISSSRPFEFLHYRAGSGGNYGLINDPVINEAIARIDAAYFDETGRRKMMKELVPYMLGQAYIIQMPEPYVYNFWQPWVRGYHGETWVGWYNLDFARYIWIDQDLKKKMTGGG